MIEIDKGLYGLSAKEIFLRKYPNDPYSSRKCFSCDIERIADAPSSRAEEDKTQVNRFSPEEFSRCRGAVIQYTRLTHTRAVEDTSERLAKGLGLDINLSRAVARAHDLGHTPFGHAGERALDEIMRELKYDGFDHNNQSLRTVELLETINPDFPGLNLTRGVLDGIKVKYSPRPNYLLLEGQLVDVADSISYIVHDIEDALYLGFLNPDDLKENSLTKKALDKTSRELGNTIKMSIITRHIRKNLRQEIESSVIKNCKDLLCKFQDLVHAEDLECDNIKFYYTKKPVIIFGKRIQSEFEDLRRLLYDKYYHHKVHLELEEKQREYIREVFFFLLENPSTMKIRNFYVEMFYDDDISICIKDYIALLTEKNFQRLYQYMKSTTA